MVSGFLPRTVCKDTNNILIIQVYSQKVLLTIMFLALCSRNLALGSAAYVVKSEQVIESWNSKLGTIYLRLFLFSIPSFFVFSFSCPIDTPCTLNEMFFRKLWVLGGKALSFGVKRIELRPKTSALFSPSPDHPVLGTPLLLAGGDI